MLSNYIISYFVKQHVNKQILSELYIIVLICSRIAIQVDRRALDTRD